MTNKRQIKKSYATALFVFGIISIFGLGFLMYRVLDKITVQNSNILFLLVFLFIGVAAALFLLGIFLGYFYRKPEPQNKQPPRKHQSHYKKALKFERSEKSRLEQNLQEARQTIVGLKDRLARLDRERKKKQQTEQKPPEKDEHTLKELEDLKARQRQLENDLNRRKERIADLQAEIAMAQSENANAQAEIQKLRSSLEPQRMTLAIAKEDASLKDILSEVTALEGIYMAIIADDYGLVVETAGADFPAEKLAAVSSLLSQVGGNVDDIFSLGTLETITLADDKGFVLENFYFQLFDLRCALTLARDKEHTYPGLAEQTIEAIISRLDN